MNVQVHIDHQSGRTTIRFPNRSLGGYRSHIDDLDMLDLVQLRAAIDKAIGSVCS